MTTPPSTLPSDFEVIDTRAGLMALGERLKPADEIYFDTEFHVERTYFSTLMLIQLSTETELAVIDPLAPEIRGLIGTFLRILVDQGKAFVGHALDRDLEIFYRLSSVVPKRVFDTQIAAAFLGLGSQAGLSKLLSVRLGVNLPKLYTRADWSKRPLPAEQLRYAVDDVRYLPALVADLRAGLAAAGRTHWADQEMAPLAEVATHQPPDPNEAWQRVPRRPPDDSRGVLAVRTLAAARERLAQEQNRPAHFVLRDELLLDLARRSPADESTLEVSTTRKSTRAVHDNAAIWLAALREAEALPDPERAIRYPPLTPGQDAVVSLANLIVRLYLQQHQLAGRFAPKNLDAVLRGLVCGVDHRRETIVRALDIDGWRADLLLEPLVAVLQGTSVVSVKRDDDQHLHVALGPTSADREEAHRATTFNVT